MRLLNLREIEEKYGANPLASYNLHKNFPAFADFVMHPTTLGYNTQNLNEMLAKPDYAVGAGDINTNNMVAGSFLGDFFEGVKKGIKGVVDVAGPLLPLLVGLGREEHDISKEESDSEAEEEADEEKHKAHEMQENVKLKKLKKVAKVVKATADSMLKANRKMLRAELVRKIMKERGVSMIKASQIIKAENLKY
jgi:hypothetical protein